MHVRKAGILLNDEQPNWTLIAQLKMKKTILIEKSWWWPFSKCSTKPNENFCEHKMTEMEIIRNCSCSYGHGAPQIIHEIYFYQSFITVPFEWRNLQLSEESEDSHVRLLYPAIDKTNVRECNFTGFLMKSKT